MERWLPVLEFPAYEVSDEGRVRSTERRVSSGNGGWRLVKERVLKPRANGGYLEVALHARRYRLVHRLVLEAFVSPCPSGMEGCHDDGNRANCRLGNLRWDTHQRNMDDMVAHGTRRSGHQHPRASLSEEVEQWVRDSSQGPYVLAALLGVTQKVIYRARGDER